MADLDTIVGQVQVYFSGKYEGSISNLRVGANRPVQMQGVASGENVVGVGIEKITVSFDRPVLKDSTRQLSSDMLRGPIDIDYVRGDQIWRLVGFHRSTEDMTNNPDAGNTSESISGSAKKRIRVR